MQIFEVDRAVANKTKAETLKILVDSGVDINEALLISKLKENE